MLFNSYEFVLAFLPAVVIIYFLLNKFTSPKPSKVFLVIASLFFYGYYNWSYLAVILTSIFVNYFLSIGYKKTEEKKSKKFLFAISLIWNIGLIIFFKYTNFIVSNINTLFKSNIDFLNVIMPLGISFFTFQQISYMVDCYRDTENVETSFVNYALYISFFPQLVAGPIMLHSEMLPQFEDEAKRKVNYDNIAKGLYAFGLGLGKKVIIADAVGVIVDAFYGNITGSGTINALIAILAYTFQIYFDFSGYCDMATGIGKMMNFDIPMNFNSPYKAVDILDFWKRWHITLTRFFTTYVYIPLGGSKKGDVRTYANVMIIFLLSGIWHGANWTFIVWGLMHGIASVLNRIVNKFYKPKSKIAKAISRLLTFIFVNLSWVVFRADSLDKSISVYKELFSFKFLPVTADMSNAFNYSWLKLICRYIPVVGDFLINHTLPIFMVGIFLIIILFRNTNEKLEKFKPSFIKAVTTAIVIYLSVVSFAGISTFLYWNF